MGVGSRAVHNAVHPAQLPGPPAAAAAQRPRQHRRRLLAPRRPGDDVLRRAAGLGPGRAESRDTPRHVGAGVHVRLRRRHRPRLRLRRLLRPRPRVHAPARQPTPAPRPIPPGPVRLLHLLPRIHLHHGSPLLSSSAPLTSGAGVERRSGRGSWPSTARSAPSPRPAPPPPSPRPSSPVRRKARRPAPLSLCTFLLPPLTLSTLAHGSSPLLASGLPFLSCFFSAPLVLCFFDKHSSLLLLTRK